MLLKKTKSILLLICIVTITFFNSCDKEETEPPCENCDEELITSLVLTFENSITGDIQEFAFRDLDGPGGNAPTQFDTIRLDATSEFHVMISLLNESVVPTEDISLEVEEEGVDHQFFWTIDPSTLVTATYDDVDANGNPIGLHMMLTTSVAGNGTTTITLKHQPDIKDGNITTGETDVEVVFITEVI